MVILCRWVVPLLMSVPHPLLLVSLLPTILFVEILSLVEVSWHVLALSELSIFPTLILSTLVCVVLSGNLLVLVILLLGARVPPFSVGLS